jgi:RNA polymerase sigma-70 factor (ECF subfamily)
VTVDVIDPDLRARAALGDRAALDAVLAAASPSIRRFTARMCRTPAEADDAAQDTLLAVSQHLGEFEGRSAFSTWLFTLARTACNRRQRTLKGAPPVEDSPDLREDAGPGPERLAERQELRETLDLALRTLQRDQREAVLLRDVEGLSANEAAEVLGISVEALKSRLHRARTALREALRPTLEGAPTTECPDIDALMSQKHEGELDDRTCSRLERHALGCPRCRALCDGMKEVLGACAALRDAG